MRVKNLLGILVVATVLLSVQAALADSVNFHSATNSIDSTTGALNVAFFVSGLGNTVTSAPVTVNADGTAVYQCINNGGNHPKAGNKETVSGPLTTTQNFPVRNGQVSGTISTGPPGPGTFSCPSGQSLFLESVTYSNTFVTIEGVTGHSTPDPISATFPFPGLSV
jgi:hypothetical protein